MECNWMTEKELYLKLKMLLLENGLSETAAAKKININSVNFNRKIKAGTLRYLEVEKLLETLGYELVWQKKA